MVRLWIEFEGKSLMGLRKTGLINREENSRGIAGLVWLWILVGHRRGGLVSC